MRARNYISSLLSLLFINLTSAFGNEALCPMNTLDIAFEKELAYFFGIKENQPIADLYFELFLKKDEEMLPILHQVYELIQSRVKWKFDTLKAAQLEQQLIYVLRKPASFEEIADSYKKIYSVIFNQPQDLFNKIGYLRAFLCTYQQQAELAGPLTPKDKSFLISIARMSEYYLQEFEQGALGKAVENSL